MGIKRLSQFLRVDFGPINIREIQGSRLAIDTLGWIYNAYFSQIEYSGDNTLMVIRNIELRLKLFKNTKSRFSKQAIFVFDGHVLPCKQKTIKLRTKNGNIFWKNPGLVN